MVEPDRLYVDLNLYNNRSTVALAQQSNTYESPILMDPSKYSGSIIRFTVDANWPLFIVTPPDPTSPLTSNISITFSYGANFYQEFVDITPDESKNGVFDFGIFLTDLNIASTAAYAAMIAANPGAPGQFPPYFALDPTSGLISMYVDSGWLDTTAPTPNLIWFNSYLEDLLGLPANIRASPPQPDGADYQIAVKSYAALLPSSGSRVGFPYALATLAGTLLQVSQEFAQLSEFSDIATIQFSSSFLPVRQELIPVTPGLSQNGTVQNNFQTIVTDFVIARSDAKPRDNSFTYNPTAEFRRFDLLGNKPLRTIDIKATFTTFSGVVYDLYLPPGGSMTLKLLLERKQ